MAAAPEAAVIRAARALCLAGAALALLAPPAVACGGFFCRNQPIDQAGEKIVFAVDQDAGNVYAVVQIQYKGDARSFSWIVPVPSRPEPSAGTDEVFRRLGEPTRPRFGLDWKVEGTCKQDFRFFGPPPPPMALGSSGGGAATAAGTEVLEKREVGPFDYTLLQSTDPQSLGKWLQDPDGDPQTADAYTIGDAQVFEELTRPYIEAGNYFVALKLLADRDTGDLRPIVLKMQERYACVPIRLTAIAAQEDMPIILWVFGKARAIPKNYYHVHLNEALIDWFGADRSPTQFPRNYDAVVTRSMADAGGNGFVTELATASADFTDALRHSYDIRALEGLSAPSTPSLAAAFMQELRNQGFPRDGLMQAIFRAYLPLPAALAGRVDELAWWNELAFGARSYESHPEYFAAFDLASASARVRAEFVQPLDEAHETLSGMPYLTRLYTTMTVSAMKAKDPLFAFRSDLPHVSNRHRATATRLCNPDIRENEAPVRLDLADGHSYTVSQGQEPFGLDSMPAALRIEQLYEDGAGETELIADNGPAIVAAIARQPQPMARTGPGCACAAPTIRLVDHGAADAEGALWGLTLGSVWLWRRRRPRR